MVRFSIFGIPVEIQPFFWLILGIFGMIVVDATSPAGLLGVALFVLAGFLSILVHEFGHAFAGKAFGSPTAIVLHSFGGLAAFPADAFTRLQHLIVIGAGPGVQIALGLLALVALPFAPSEALSLFLQWLAGISIFWALLNLIPVIPLDGGQLLATALGPGRERLSLEISIAFAILAGIGLLIFFKAIIFPIFLGMMAWQNYQQLQARGR